MTLTSRTVLGTFRVIFACWFALVMTQPVTIRACPMAGGVLEQVVPGAMPSSAEHQHMMAMDMTPHEQAPVHHHEHSKCNCIGDCCATFAIALPTYGTFVPVPERIVASAPLFPLVESSYDAPEYLRPPSTAPPTRA